VEVAPEEFVVRVVAAEVMMAVDVVPLLGYLSTSYWNFSLCI